MSSVPVIPCYAYGPDQSPAVQFIQTGWPFVQSTAVNAVGLTTQALQTLAGAQISFPPVHAEVTVGQLGNTFVPPTAPVAPSEASMTINTGAIQAVGAAPDTSASTIGGDPNWVAFPSAPGFLTNPPSFTPPVSIPVALAPFSATLPTVSTVSMPLAPTYADPTAPTPRTIVLPTLTPVVLPTFSGQRPDSSALVAPASQITFTPVKYNDALIDQIKAQLSTMLTGTTGLPVSVEQAFFDRARGRQDAIAIKAKQEVREEFAAKGWSIPPGAMAARLDEITQNAQNQSSNLNRDAYINAQNIAIENLRFSVQESIALEQVLITSDIQYQDMALRTQQLELDAAIKIFDAQVNLFNAREQAYAIDAQVYLDEIRGESLKLEQQRLALEQQRLIGELNAQDEALYEAQLRALEIKEQRYKTQLEAVNLIREQDRLNLDLYRGQLQGRETEVRAWTAEWDGYKAGIESLVAKGQFYTSLVNGYSANINAVTSQNNNLIQQKEMLVKMKELGIEGWKANLEYAQAQLTGEVARVQALQGLFDGQARIYSAAGSIAGAESDALVRAFQANVESSRSGAEVALKNGEILLNAAIQQSAQMIEVKKGVVQAGSQLAASALSAMHFASSASESFGVSTGTSCSQSVNFSA